MTTAFELEKCILCQAKLGKDCIWQDSGSDPWEIHCENCGKYLVTRRVIVNGPITKKYLPLSIECKNYSLQGKIAIIGVKNNELCIIGIEDVELYLVSELANKLRVSEMTIYRYIKAGRLDAYKLGKEFRVTKEAFGKFLKEHEL